VFLRGEEQLLETLDIVSKILKMLWNFQISPTWKVNSKITNSKKFVYFGDIEKEVPVSWKAED
jgi:hypothetical protein